MVKVFSGDNPSQLYLDSLLAILREGDDVSPRGMKVLEIRPAIFEYTNPLNRAILMKGRKMNPFFLLAEALWIIAGQSDVQFLTKYNKNMKQFSDDGVHFAAPYGERLRFWNKSNLRNYVYNPLDQLVDVYEKIKKDKDTRQAVASIYNPAFDNVGYGGKDTPCNLILTFKQRNGKLDLTVFNRSNDVHYGVFTNLAQFATIQELLASWLNVEVGVYRQITDSLHTYVKDFGYKETENILNAYNIDMNNIPEEAPEIKNYSEGLEVPRITASLEETEAFLYSLFNNGIIEAIHNDENMKKSDNVDILLDVIKSLPDAYFRDTLLSMVAYRTHRVGNKDMAFKALGSMSDSSWKVSCIRFLFKRYKNDQEFVNLYKHLPSLAKEIIEED